eukprot:gene32849-40549_t
MAFYTLWYALSEVKERYILRRNNEALLPSSSNNANNNSSTPPPPSTCERIRAISMCIFRGTGTCGNNNNGGGGGDSEGSYTSPTFNPHHSRSSTSNSNNNNNTNTRSPSTIEYTQRNTFSSDYPAPLSRDFSQ